MPLIQRDNKKVKRIAILAAVGVNVILFWIAWITGVIPPELKEFISTGKIGAPTAPPPPPPPPTKIVDVKPPPAVKPAFDPGKMSVKANIKVEMNDDMFQLKDFDMGEVDFSEMAEDFDDFNMGATEQRNSAFEVQSLMTDLIGDISTPEDRQSKFSIQGSGKRTRGRFSWSNARYPSNSWNTFVSTGGVNNFFKYVNDNLSIKIDGNAKTINLEMSFLNWLKQAKETITTKQNIEMLPEDALLQELKRSVYELTKPDMNALPNYLAVVEGAFDSYFNEKYAIPFKDRPLSEVIKDFKKEGKPSWFLADIEAVFDILQKIGNAENKQDVDGTELRKAWMFAKKCEILEAPLLYFRGAPGINATNNDMISILKVYIRNGGFIYIDDASTLPPSNANDETRAFIQRLTGKKNMDEVAKKVFEQLSSNDRKVSGYELLGTQPESFHPFGYIQFILPELTPVSIRIYNKVGYLVREYELGELPAGTYNDRKSAPKWDCKDQKGNDIASGTYFIQIQAGIFMKTQVTTVSHLRMLDSKHPIYSAVYNFDNVPIGYLPLKPRPYGNATFGYNIADHLAIVFNEGNSTTDGCSTGRDPATLTAASKWISNIVVFALTQPTGIVSKR